MLFTKALIGIVANFCILLFIILFLFLKKKIKKESSELKFTSQIKAVAIGFFIFTQPGIVYQTLNFLSCVDIDGKNYSKADYNVECNSPFYNNSIIPTMTVILLIYMFIVPAFLYFSLKSNQKYQKV